MAALSAVRAAAALPGRPDTEPGSGRTGRARALRARSGGALAALAAPLPLEAAQEVKTLTLTLSADPVWRPGPQFTAQPGQTVSFTHPLTGTNHTLTVLALAPETLDVSGLPDVQEYPAHCLRLEYAVSPELPPDALQIRDTAPTDPPRLKIPENRSGEVPVGGAACIGIIGGEDGRPAFLCPAARRQTAGSPIPTSISHRRNRSHGSCGFRSSRVGKFQKNFVDFLLAISRKRARIAASF